MVIYDEDLRLLSQTISHIDRVRAKGIFHSDNSLPVAYSTSVLQMRATDFREVDMLKGALLRGGAAGAATAWLSWAAVGALGTASTSTAISTLTAGYATNAILAWFGGGSLAVGGMGMAGGALVLGGIVLAPLLAIIAFTMSKKAHEALEQAQQNWQEAENAAQQMDQARGILELVHYRAQEMNTLLQQHHDRLRPLISHILTFVDQPRDKENLWQSMRSSLRRLLSSWKWMAGVNQALRNRRNPDLFTYAEQRSIKSALILAQSAKNLVDVPLFTPQGDPAEDAVRVIAEGNRALQSASE